MTNTILQAIKIVIEGHTWASRTPNAVVVGPIPKALRWPVVGILATGGQVNEETTGSFDQDDKISITVAMPLKLGTENQVNEDLLLMRDEIISIIYANPLWDLPAVKYSQYESWDSVFGAFSEDSGGMLLQYVTVEMTVRYSQTI